MTLYQQRSLLHPKLDHQAQQTDHLPQASQMCTAARLVTLLPLLVLPTLCLHCCCWRCRYHPNSPQTHWFV
jgi:hypothetical protein